MAQEKTYKVVSDFNDASGKAWKAGQQYTGSPQEVQAQLAAGTIAEDTSQQSPASVSRVRVSASRKDSARGSFPQDDSFGCAGAGLGCIHQAPHLYCLDGQVRPQERRP